MTEKVRRSALDLAVTDEFRMSPSAVRPGTPEMAIASLATSGPLASAAWVSATRVGSVEGICTLDRTAAKFWVLRKTSAEEL